MIVDHTAEGWEIIFQSAHALLAGRLAPAMSGLSSTPYWVETLAAIVDHDDLKESFGKNVYITSLGAPKDFTEFALTANERYREVKRRIQSGYRKHRWIGLVASRHAEGLYGGENTSRRLQTLLEVERTRRQTVLGELGATREDLEKSYELLSFCDRTSLILCQNEIPAMHRRSEIITSNKGQRYELWEREDRSLAVDPWPFHESFVVSVEVRTVNQLEFSSDRELERRLTASPVENRKWKLERAA